MSDDYAPERALHEKLFSKPLEMGQRGEIKTLETDVNVDQSLTASVKLYLDYQSSWYTDDGGALRGGYVTGTRIEMNNKSVLECAQEAGLTLQQYVSKNPDRAIMEAEATLADWLRIETSAGLNGEIKTDEGSWPLTKNMTKLIEQRTIAAEKQRDMIYEYAYTAIRDDERRRDHLIRTAYNRAVFRGDTRMLIYLMDRVDGRPGESKVADLDYDNAYNVYQIIHTLFDKQLEVLNSGSGTKLICCSRRSGKTMLLVAACMIECLRVPNTNCIYIGETLELTEQLINQAANQIIDQCKLRDRRGKRLNWRKFDNGSTILVRGLSNTKDPDLIRGNKAKIIVIDEFFHLKGELLHYLVQEVLQPMQMDYATDYKFICAGTPPPIKGTYGENAWKTWEVPHYTWIYKDNPHPLAVEDRERFVEQALKEKGLDWSSTYARREYLGEWLYDDDLLLYPEFHTYNPREAYPSFNIDQVLFGIDYGVGDHDTLIGIAWDSSERRGYVFHENKFNRLDIKDRTISQLQYLESCIIDAWTKALEFFPTLTPKEANKRILWDADDNEQRVTDHFNMNVRLKEYPELRLNIENAHKTQKIQMFDKIRDLLRTAHLLFIENGICALEATKTVLKRGPNGQVYPEVDMKTYHPDALPALRYALWNVIGQESAPKNA
jgi:hypothetical protein